MKSINYALLVSLSSFMLTACGGGSTKVVATEASADDVAVLIPLPESTEEDSVISRRVAETTEVDYSNVDWIPSKSATESQAKLSYKVEYSANPTISQKLESDGTDTEKWSIYSGDRDSATISSVDDAERGSKVIEFSGDGLHNGYLIGYSFNSNTGWNDTVDKTIKWSMKFNEEYIIYVRVSTTEGYRYLYYTANNRNYGISSYDSPHYIHNGLGTASDDGEWLTVSRNLSADLNRFEPMNKITSVDGFFVRGSGRIDDVELLKTEATVVNETIYEDAEDGLIKGWNIYDTSPTGADIKNVVDADTGSKVIELKGTGINNGFVLGTWNNTINKEISWDMKTDNNYVVYVNVLTEEGQRFMTYTPLSATTYNSNPNYQDPEVTVIGDYTYVNHYLPPSTRNGSWNTVSRNLELDLKDYEPNNKILAVSAFFVRGDDLRLDNIKMFDTNEDGDFDNSTN